MYPDRCVSLHVGMSVVEGRRFEESDAAEVSEFGWGIVNQTMAERLWARASAGQQLQVVGIKELYVYLFPFDCQMEVVAERRVLYDTPNAHLTRRSVGLGQRSGAARHRRIS